MVELSTIFNARKRIAVGILGQSNERGQVTDTPEADYLQAYESANNPGVFEPLPGVLSTNSGPYRRRGSGWMKFYDELWDHGYDCQFFNGSIGSLSLISDCCGLVRTRSNSTGYSKRRAPAGPEDRGFYGDLTVQSSKLFRCKTGRSKYATWANPWAPDGAAVSQYYLDYITTVGSEATAASTPDFSTATLGSTVTDGTVEWECIDATNSVGFSNNQILGPNQISYGFDPLGIMSRLHQEMQRIRDVEERYIIVQNGQSDYGQSSSNYQAALTNIANFFLQRGYHVVLGLSTYWGTPNDATRITNHGLLQTGLANALTAFASNPKVHAGADLVALMGTDPTTFAQGDNTHWDADGAIVAGGHMADAFKAFLPERTV